MPPVGRLWYWAVHMVVRTPEHSVGNQVPPELHEAMAILRQRATCKLWRGSNGTTTTTFTNWFIKFYRVIFMAWDSGVNKSFHHIVIACIFGSQISLLAPPVSSLICKWNATQLISVFKKRFVHRTGFNIKTYFIFKIKQ